MTGFFDGFELEFVAVRDGKIRVRRGGSGPPLLLLHGNPQTHAMWHRIAPALAQSYTVICADLRGYGQSFKPPVTADHAPYAKVEMARDMVEVMGHYGFESFFVGSHDRGSRVAHRMALDYPDRVRKLAVLDIVPTIEHFERTDMAFAMGYYHWFWLAQPHPFPENLINAAPDVWFKSHTSREPKGADFFAAPALADYLDAIRRPEAIVGMCEDYRAAATIDLVHDRQTRAEGCRVRCPMRVHWGAKGLVGRWYEPLAIWQAYCDTSVTGGPVASGHYLAEEAPDAIIASFASFFR